MRSPIRPVALAGSFALLLSIAPSQANMAQANMAQENTARVNFAPAEGEVFPELAFPTLEGTGLASLRDYRGQKVLLMQFASW